MNDNVIVDCTQYVDQYVASFVESKMINLIDQIYPIGSIYYNALDVDPNQFLIGVWEKIENRFLLASGDYTLGSVGGESSHKLSVDELPSHTHTRGTMNITGTLSGTRTHVAADSSTVQNWCHGALYTTVKNGTYTAMQTSQFTSSTQATGDGVCLDASKNWTGETSSVGSSQSHNNMPPYLVVNVWKRVA